MRERARLAGPRAGDDEQRARTRVDRRALIPRPETETVVERCLALLAGREAPRVLDVGTGSGAIALAIKRHLPAARVVATDASAAALEVAKRNAVRFALEIELRHGRWFEPLAGERFEAIICNPPYVVADDPHLAGLQYEPRFAIVAGADGLDGFRVLAREAPAHLQPGGWLLLEHGAGQHAAVRELLEELRESLTAENLEEQADESLLSKVRRALR